MSDRIEITGIRAVGHHGVYDFETRDGQPFVVDVTLWLDLAPGQTGPDNLTPIGRRWHRYKTMAGCQTITISPGVLHWRTRLGYCYLTSPHGTTSLAHHQPLVDHYDQAHADHRDAEIIHELCGRLAQASPTPMA